MMALRQSSSYFWSVSEAIGQGATGNVFICRSKANGKAYAAKVFNHTSQMRAKEVRSREIDLLRKLSNPNIVELVDEEIEKVTGTTVLIMELCDTSLYNILELPENYYGLSEEEFKNVFRDVANGMKYLKEQNVVHRDVKPGNILKTRSLSGSSVYKLTDFGAARELQQADQRFMSIYGTEEYLHPDVYEKAIMKNFSKKSFNAAVDLWSMGVTFYHAATGQLPFRPFGGRQNKETMFEILSNKGPGIISGVQKNNGGRIDYDENLPDDTRISNGLKVLLQPALQELLETNPKQPEHMINFEQFYKRMDDIIQRQVIDVYVTGSGSWHKVYIHPQENVDKLLEIIYKQTGTEQEMPSMYWDSREIVPGDSSHVSDYAKLTRQNPLIVVGGDVLQEELLLQKNIPNPPRMPKGKTRPDNDMDILKVYAGSCYMYKFCAEDIFWSYNACFTAISAIQTVTKNKILHCERKLQDLKRYWSLVNSSQTSSINDLQLIRDIANIACETRDEPEYSQPEDDVTEKIHTLKVTVPERLSSIANRLLFKNWLHINEQLRANDWMATIEKHVEDVNSVYLQISNKKFTALPNHEDLIHVAEKQKVSDGLEVIKDHFGKLKTCRGELHLIFNNWIRENRFKLEEISKMEKDFGFDISTERLEESAHLTIEKIESLKKSLLQRIKSSFLAAQSMSSVNNSNAMDMNLINEEVMSLETVLQDILTLVKDGDLKLLKTKEIFDELAFDR